MATGQSDERETRDDQGLAEELESLYRHVARLDQEEPSGERGESPLPGDAQGPIVPAAVPSHVRPGDGKFAELPSGNRGQGQDALAERLDEIADAYEEILTLLPHTAKHPHPASSGDASAEIVNGETRRYGVIDTRTFAAARHSLFRRYSWPVGGLAAALVIIVMTFVWPTIYRYDSLTVGNTVYPLRINRLTSQLAYFDGNAWLGSLIVKGTPPPGVSAHPSPARSVMAPPEIAAAPAGNPAAGIAEPPSPSRSGSPEKPVPSASPADSSPETGSVSDTGKMPPVARNDSPNHPDTTGMPRERGRSYSIQIKAFRDEQEARAFAADLKKRETEIRIDTILLEGSGIWHRILWGSFKTEREASEYLIKKKAKERYPGSFIQESQKIR